MTEHEPECQQARPPWTGECDCDRLRAAFKRGQESRLMLKPTRDEGFRAGAEQMRERAARLMEGVEQEHDGPTFAQEIRAMKLDA